MEGNAGMSHFRNSVFFNGESPKHLLALNPGLRLKLLSSRLIVSFFISLLICAAVSTRSKAAVWKCQTANDITAPRKPGDLFAGGWRLTDSKCSETGVYYYSFINPGRKRLTIALNLAAVTGIDSVDRTKYVLYADGIDGADGFTPEVLALKEDISKCVNKWDSRLQKADKAAWAIVIALIVISIMWITAIAEQAKKSRTGLIWNVQLFLASFILTLSVIELGFRGFNVSYKDSGMMAFMADVRDQAVLHGGFRRIGKSALGSADSDREVNEIG
ncbi:MAG: hypothetical protein WCX65_14090, partial [bacterium]